MAFKYNKHRRTSIVNPAVQFKLIGYALCSAAVSSSITYFALTSVVNSWTEFGTLNVRGTLLAGLLILAQLILIVLAGYLITNQIAGPLARLQRNLRRIVEGEKPETIHLRAGDSYADLIADYNRLVEYLKK